MHDQSPAVSLQFLSCNAALLNSKDLLNSSPDKVRLERGRGPGMRQSASGSATRTLGCSCTSTGFAASIGNKPAVYDCCRGSWHQQHRHPPGFSASLGNNPILSGSGYAARAPGSSRSSAPPGPPPGFAPSLGLDLDPRILPVQPTLPVQLILLLT